MIANKFSKGDPVQSKGGVFWMTIKSVNDFGFYSCTFGNSGRDAGTFRESELTTYTGAV